MKLANMPLSCNKVSAYCKRIWSRENVIRVAARAATRIAVVVVWSGVLWSLLGTSALPLQYFIAMRDGSCFVSQNIQAISLDNVNESVVPFPLPDAVDNETVHVLSNSEFSLVALSFDSTSNEYNLLQVKRSQQCDYLLELRGVYLDQNWTVVSKSGTEEIDLNDILTMEEPASLTYIPDGHFFALALLLIFSSICGYLAKLIFLPPLFGMIVAGIILRNVPYINFAKDIQPTWSSTIRNIALVIILIRGGLSMKLKDLKRLKHAVLILGAFPCILEGAVDGLIATYFLNMPWQWGFLLGYVYPSGVTLFCLLLLLLCENQPCVENVSNRNVCIDCQRLECKFC